LDIGCRPATSGWQGNARPVSQRGALSEGIAVNGDFGENEVMSVAELPITIDREKIAAFCRERRIRRLNLFE